MAISIREARVAMVGLGALGCEVLPRLARLPLAGITLVDGDNVEENNLDRQQLYAAMDVGYPKATTARGWALLVGPALDIHAEVRFLDAGNAADLLRGHQLVIDCTDDLHAKRIIDEECATLHIPLVSGAVHERQGQVLLLHAAGAGASLRRTDLYRGTVGPEQDGCDMRRVPLDLIEVVGERMYQLARAVLNAQPVVNGRIELCDLNAGVWRSFDAPRS
ncbi:MAG: ThiF family adenylyltransferase [Flavobacteriales bacterium]|nr:ThiF family adenylyltransferase [Flavobacteriales bacterium]